VGAVRVTPFLVVVSIKRDEPASHTISRTGSGTERRLHLPVTIEPYPSASLIVLLAIAPTYSVVSFMVFKGVLGKMDLSNVQPKSREEHRKTLDRWFKSQRELERICKEQGIPVPIMVC
jgi:hypothetical protein